MKTCPLLHCRQQSGHLCHYWQRLTAAFVCRSCCRFTVLHYLFKAEPDLEELSQYTGWTPVQPNIPPTFCFENHSAAFLLKKKKKEKKRSRHSDQILSDWMMFPVLEGTSARSVWFKALETQLITHNVCLIKYNVLLDEDITSYQGKGQFNKIKSIQTTETWEAASPLLLWLSASLITRWQIQTYADYLFLCPIKGPPQPTVSRLLRTFGSD